MANANLPQDTHDDTIRIKDEMLRIHRRLDNAMSRMDDHWDAWRDIRTNVDSRLSKIETRLVATELNLEVIRRSIDSLISALNSNANDKLDYTKLLSGKLYEIRLNLGKNT